VWGWTIDAQLATAELAKLPGLVDSRQVRGRTHLVIADANDETEAAVRRISVAARREELSLEDAVLAYLRPSATVGSISEALENAR
jgi:hypothetical protein